LIGVLLLSVALTHEFVFAVAAMILILRALIFHRKESGLRKILVPILIVLVGIGAYSLIRFELVLGLINSVFANNYHPEGVPLNTMWERFDWWLSLGILSLGFVIPLALLGFFRDDTMFIWLIVTLGPYVSFAISTFSFNQPERYLYLAAIPVCFYASSFLRKADSRKLSFYGVLVLLSIQPISMIGITPLPLSIYAEKRYGVFPDVLSPSIPPEQIVALQVFMTKGSEIRPFPSSMIVPTSLAFQEWAKYYFPSLNVSLAGSTWSQTTLESGQTLFYITFNGMSTPTNRTSALLSSYGGLDFFVIR
jgi:hypothetical protein